MPGRRGEPGAAGAAALDEDPLGDQLDLHLSGRDLLLTRGRSARAYGERRDQLLDLVVLGEDLTPGRAGITERVADERELLRALITQRADQGRRKAVRDTEAGDGNRGSVRNVRNGLLGRFDDLVHGDPFYFRSRLYLARAGHTGSL